MHDNTAGPVFLQRIQELWPTLKPLAFLDIGCAGGKLVKDALDLGIIAAGLEGSDFSLARQRAEWATIPHNLFVCDVTHEFTLTSEHVHQIGLTSPFRFDVISAWEVMEHLPEARLPQFFKNVLAHLMPYGIFACSISSQHGYHHVTLHERDWWLQQFDKAGFKEDARSTDKFNGAWVRGPGEPQSFNLAVIRKNQYPE